MSITRRTLIKASAAGLALSGLGVGAARAAAKMKPAYYFPGMEPEEVAKAAKPKEPIGKTVNVGFLAALSGPDAGWGLPGITGNQLYIDEVNSQGGLLVGGTRYPLKMYKYDDEAIGSKALQGAKQLVLQHDVKFISAIGGNPADAVHPFLTKHKVIYASLISPDIKPDRPYLIAGGDVTPRIDMLRPMYHKLMNPNFKRWAVVSQDDSIGQTCQAWEVGCAIAEGWDVVYDKHYTVDTTDFAPIVTAILATKPDVVSLNLSYPDFVVAICEQLYLQGFKGPVSANYIEDEAVLTKVPKEWLEGAVNSFPLFDDPWWGDPSVQNKFLRDWMSRYGPGAPEDVHRNITGIDWDHAITFRVWGEGCTLAGSFDPDKVLAALRASKHLPTLLGPAQMRGEDMWGINNMISPPIPICEVRNGSKRVQAVVRYEKWFDARKDTIVKVVREKGQMWDQRK